jgi:uncharacterized membrane protein
VGEAAVKLAAEHGLVVELLARPGEFVVVGQASAMVWPAERVTDQMAAEVSGTFILSRTRTPAQDPGFIVEQLTEIASRALSRGINDPFTACVCIDYLGAALVRLAGRRMPSSVRTDRSGRGRVIVTPVAFGELLNLACDPLHEYGSSHRMVVLRLAWMLRRLARVARRPADRAAVLRHCELLRVNAERRLSDSAGWAGVRSELDGVVLEAAEALPDRAGSGAQRRK